MSVFRLQEYIASSRSLFSLCTRLSVVVVVVAATLSDKVMETGVAAVLRKGQVVGRNRLPISSRDYKKRRSSSYTVLLERESVGHGSILLLRALLFGV